MRIRNHLFYCTTVLTAASVLCFDTVQAQNNEQDESESVAYAKMDSSVVTAKDIFGHKNVVAQMNYCISALTNIIENKSMTVLEHESDQIVNNLTMEHIAGLDDIKDFRGDLLDAIGKFQITEEERAIIRKQNSLKRDNLKWSALSNALGSAMFIIPSSGGGNAQAMAAQAVFYTLVSAARTAVEYKSSQADADIEELNAMWELRKEDLKNINALRKTALDITYDLFTKYGLKEKDRLTEKTAKAFCEYIAIPDPDKRIRLLEDNMKTYKDFPDYYYYLGMAYVDVNKYAKAKDCFAAYLRMYEKAPIFRQNEKKGCIALTVMANEPQLDEQHRRALVETVISNMPNNSAAVLQCAMAYIYELGEEQKGLNLLRSGLEDPYATDISLLFMATQKLLTQIEKYPSIKSSVDNAFLHTGIIGLQNYLLYLTQSKENAWPEIENGLCFNFKKTSKKFKPEHLRLDLPSRIRFEPNEVEFFQEFYNDSNLFIWRLDTQYDEVVSLEEIEKVKCFKENKGVKYLFMDVVEPNSTFRVKDNLDYSKIEDGTWPRMSEFPLKYKRDKKGNIKFKNDVPICKDIKEIIKFCKVHAPASNSSQVRFTKCSTNDPVITEDNGFTITAYGGELPFKPLFSKTIQGDYLRLVFKDSLTVIYKSAGREGIGPYLYQVGSSIQFATSEYKEEYEAVFADSEKKVDAGTKKKVGFFKRLFHSHDVSENGGAEKKTSFFRRLFHRKNDN